MAIQPSTSMSATPSVSTPAAAWASSAGAAAAAVGGEDQSGTFSIETPEAGPSRLASASAPASQPQSRSRSPGVASGAEDAHPLRNSTSATTQQLPAQAQPIRTPDYRLTQTVYAHKRAVTALRWSSDGRMLVSAGE